MGSEMIDSTNFRRALGRYASGITVVSGMSGGEPVGFTCQSFHSVSLRPPLILLSVMQGSSSWPKIRDSRTFCVNVLAQEQRHISDGFARSGSDKWAGVEWSSTVAGNPVIDGVLAWFDCDLYAEHAAGDHIIVVGKVRDFVESEEKNSGQPLLYFKGQYGKLAA